jgi:hypothetical protein
MISIELPTLDKIHKCIEIVRTELLKVASYDYKYTSGKTRMKIQEETKMLTFKFKNLLKIKHIINNENLKITNY